MEDTAFSKSFAIACGQHGTAYIQARDTIVSLGPDGQTRAIAKLKEAAADRDDWERQLTAEILIGCMTNKKEFVKCGDYVRGKLPPPAPLPGFTAQYRAKAIAGLGKAITPRVLELLYKTREVTADIELAAAFGALVYLEDRRAVMPMIALIDEANSTSVQQRAVNVLSSLRDPRGLDPVLRLARNPQSEQTLRASAIQALGCFEDRRATEELVQIVTRDDQPLEDRRAAGQGLRTRLDPATRTAVAAVLPGVKDQVLRLTLIRILGEVGTAVEIPLLQKLAEGGDSEVQDSVADAVEEIQTRQRQDQGVPE